MQLTISTIEKIKELYPINLISGDDFSWNNKKNSVIYDPNHENGLDLLLHELGHATLKHSEYKKDINLLTMERDAWLEAQKISAQHFNYEINQDLIEDYLDSYRDWIHSRSKCPNCSANGIEIDESIYKCLICSTKWKVNESRMCQLKRTTLK